MSVAHSAVDLSSSPSIGDLLLRHGYVSPEKLEWAEGIHRQTGEPIGQILVEDGALSRLELASALAEQWSATSSWGPAPPAPAAPRESREADATSANGGLIARVEAIEIALRSSPGDAVASDGLAQALAVLGERLERVESSVQSAALRYEELVVAVDDAVCAHDERLDAIEARGAEPNELGQALLQRVDDIAAQSRAHSEEFEDLRSLLAMRIDELADATGDLPGTVRVLEAQIASVAERMEASDVSLALENALARIEGEAAVRDVSLAELGDQLGGLTGRVDAAAKVLEELTSSPRLDELAALVNELAARPDPDLEAAARLAEASQQSVSELAELGERLAELDARIVRSAESAEVAELRAIVDGFVAATDEKGAVAPAELAGRLAGLGERIDQIAQRLEDTSDRDRLDAAVADLSLRLDLVRDDGGLEAMQARLEEIAAGARGQEDTLAALTATLDELSSRSWADDVRSLEQALHEVDERVGQTIDPDAVAALAARLDALELVRTTVGEALTELDTRLGEVREASNQDGIASLLEELRRRQDDLDVSLDRIVAEEDRDESRPGTAEIEALAARVDAVEIRVSRENAEPVDAASMERLAALEERTAQAVGHDDLRGVHERLAQLGERLERLEGVVPSTTVPVPGSDEKVDALEARLIGLERRLVTSAQAPPTKGDDAVSERELDYLRVAVEGVGMRLAEQQRALAPLLRTPDIGARMDALAARVSALLGAGLAAVVSPDGEPMTIGASVDAPELLALASRLEGIESSVRSDREKVLVQIERLASSFDWRIRRMEDGASDATRGNESASIRQPLASERTREPAPRPS